MPDELQPGNDGISPIHWTSENAPEAVEPSASSPVEEDTTGVANAQPFAAADSSRDLLPPVDEAESTDGERRRRRWVPILILLGVIGAAIAIALATRGGNSSSKLATASKASSTDPQITYPSTATTTKTSTTSSAKTTTTVAAGGTASGGARTGSGGTGSSATTPPTAPKTSPTAPTTTAIPAPVVTSVSSSLGAIYCTKPSEYYPLTITWTTQNATTVDLSGAATTTGELPNSNFVINDACATNYVTVTAHGPGGTATGTVSWHYLTPPPT